VPRATRVLDLGCGLLRVVSFARDWGLGVNERVKWSSAEGGEFYSREEISASL